MFLALHRKYTYGSSNGMIFRNLSAWRTASLAVNGRDEAEPGSGVLSLNSLGNKEGLRETRAGLVGSSGG